MFTTLNKWVWKLCTYQNNKHYTKLPILNENRGNSFIATHNYTCTSHGMSKSVTHSKWVLYSLWNIFLGDWQPALPLYHSLTQTTAVLCHSRRVKNPQELHVWLSPTCPPASRLGSLPQSWEAAHTGNGGCQHHISPIAYAFRRLGKNRLQVPERLASNPRTAVSSVKYNRSQFPVLPFPLST